jgi:hypothetical protein
MFSAYSIIYGIFKPQVFLSMTNKLEAKSHLNRNLFSDEQAKNSCDLNPCKNSGVCIPMTKTNDPSRPNFLCKCKGQFIGALCELTDYCQNASLSCLNGGSCINNFDGYKCLCAKEWTGKQCESMQLACTASMCHNGGTCTLRSNAVECRCPNNYNGQYCEIFDICSLRPCKNNGVCTLHSPSRLECKCETGFFGKFCELFDPCLNTPCANNGTCRSFLNDNRYDYECACTGKFSGKNCDKCVGNFNGPRCDKCMNGFFGASCDQVVNNCEQNVPCKHGFCKFEYKQGYKCHCFEGK